MSWTVGRWAAVRGLEHGFGSRHDRPPGGLTVVRQVHGRTVHAAREIPREGAEGDGVIVAAGEGAAVRTADCVPVMLVAPDARAAAAVHAGWRGAAAGIVDAALARLDREWGAGPGRIDAALGPSIGGCCYEVGEEVRDAFTRAWGAAGERGFETRRDGGRPALHLDLRRHLEGRLRELGVAWVESIGPCTGCAPAVLCSYRKEGPATGRQHSWLRWTL